MYKPPEAFYKGGTVEGKPCDIWAFGIMTVEILVDFFLSNKLPYIEHNWLIDVHPTLNEILQEQVFKTHFDGTFLKVEKNEDKVSRIALDFIHGFLKMDPSERVTSSQAKQHPFLNGGTDVVNAPDDIWNSELYMDGTELDDCFCSLEEDDIGFYNEDASIEASDFLNMALKDFNTSENENSKTFGTQILVSRPSQVTTQMSTCHTNVPELDSEASQATSNVIVYSETTVELKSTNKFDAEHGISLSEKIQNLRVRIKELIENYGHKKGENVLKDEPIADTVYFQIGDVGLTSKETNELHKGVKSNSKFSVEDCATGSKPTSLEATLELVEAIKTLLKRYEDYKAMNFLSIDVSRKECQEEILQINFGGHNSAEANLPVDSTSTTVFETRGRRQRFIGWLQSKCLSVLNFCCPCIAVKNSSEDM